MTEVKKTQKDFKIKPLIDIINTDNEPDIISESMKPKSTHGGANRGQGRKKSLVPKVVTSFKIRKDRKNEFREFIKPILKRFNDGE